MSLFSRISAPSTPATQGSSLFGGASTTPATTSSSGLFGSSTPTSTPAPSGGLFGPGISTTTAPSSGFFGPGTGTTTAPSTSFFGPGTASGTGTTTAPSSSFFGPSTGTTTAPSSGLFGPGTGATTAPSSGLLGSGTGSGTTTAPSSGLSGPGIGTTTAPSNNLFGSSSATPAASTAGGGLFGSGTAATTSAPAASGGLFGSGTTTTSAPGSGGLFGGTFNTKPPAAPTPAATTGTSTGGGLFVNTQSGPGGAGGGMFAGDGTQGTAQQHQQSGGQNSVPAATIDFTKLTPTTRFGDCHQSVQQSLEQIEAEIQEQIRMSQQLADRFSSHREALDTIPVDASVLTNRLATTKSFQTSDQAAFDQVRTSHDEDDNASTLSIRTLDLFRLPHAQRSQYIQRNSTYSAPQRENDVTGNRPMITYFNKQANEMERKMEIVRRTVREVEESLVSVEAQAAVGAMGTTVEGRDITAVTGGVAGRQDARRLNSALREFNDALRDVSGRIVDSRDALELLKQRR